MRLALYYILASDRSKYCILTFRFFISIFHLSSKGVLNSKSCLATTLVTQIERPPSKGVFFRALQGCAKDLGSLFTEQRLGQTGGTCAVRKVLEDDVRVHMTVTASVLCVLCWKFLACSFLLSVSFVWRNGISMGIFGRSDMDE